MYGRVRKQRRRSMGDNREGIEDTDSLQEKEEGLRNGVREE